MLRARMSMFYERISDFFEAEGDFEENIEPECDCGSLYTDPDDGETIHYEECSVIRYRLGYL